MEDETMSNANMCGKTRVEESPNTCEQNSFKKARFPWQIKGHPHGRGKTNIKEDHLYGLGIVEANDHDIKEADSGGGHSQLGDTLEEENLSYDGNDSDAGRLIAIDTETHGSKRKCCSVNNETVKIETKRAKTSQESCTDNQSESSTTTTGRFFNLQAGCSSSTSNPDLSRALSSILPNFNGLDIPSFIWQKQEMGCAIVDNVFNRTIEEMGLSPDPVVNLNASTRLSLENQSIESAIRNQGLRASGSQTEEQRIINNMVEMQKNVTTQDFQHTQAQLSMMMNSERVEPMGHDKSMVESEAGSTSCISDFDFCDSSHGEIETDDNHDISRVNCEDQDNALVNSNAGVDHSNETTNRNVALVCNFETKNDEQNDVTDHVTEHKNDSLAGSAVHITDTIYSHCKTKPDGNSQKVLDLAVSTAILSQGLTLDSV